MKITDISVQAKNNDRVNVSIDGKYRFSLDIAQVGELGLKVGKEYAEEELTELESESQFGKLYARALEYCLMRPHSAKEVRDYLWRKTRTTKYKTRSTGEIKEREGASKTNAERTFNRLVERGYVNDESFTRYWVENRNSQKGASRRKLTAELRAKGVDQSVIDRALSETERDETEELKKVLAKKRNRYEDEQKLIAHLMRQGFRYDDIREALSEEE